MESPEEPKQTKVPFWRKHRKLLIAAGVALLLLIAVGLAAWKLARKGAQISSHEQAIGIKAEDSAAIKAGKQLSGGQCEGEGVPEKLSESPMKAADFTMVIPYGLVVGDHVTPIDHQYFSPADYQSPVNAYEVRAMGDGRITSIGARENSFLGATEYRMVFTQTCTFHYYYDLVTGLAPDLKAAFDASAKGNYYTQNGFNFEVKAGQVIGYIGGRTLDFAVWDTTKPLAGFVVPEHYAAESWKLYTADPLDYYTDELKRFILSKYVRTAEPVSGKIDHDIDGRLIGNWFREGTDYGGPIGATQHGPGGERGHLAIAPEHLDPTTFVISIGDYQGKSAQFAVKGNAPWPADISAKSGPMKYELVQIDYTKPDGSHWDRTSFIRSPRMRGGSTVQGTVLVQLLEDRKLKFEAFPGKTAAQVSGFTDQARIYTR
jgi:hypothetical protein